MSTRAASTRAALMRQSFTRTPATATTIRQADLWLLNRGEGTLYAGSVSELHIGYADGSVLYVYVRTLSETPARPAGNYLSAAAYTCR